VRYDSFVSDLPEEEFRKRWEEFKKEVYEHMYDNEYARTDDKYLDIYDWLAKKRDDGKTVYTVCMDEYYMKHYDMERLAEFISKVIDGNDSCILELVGEDGDLEGWYIRRGSVDQIKYVRMISCDVALREKNGELSILNMSEWLAAMLD